MAAGIRRILRWREATVVSVREETSTARTLDFDIPGWSGHIAGQHVDIRLTAEDGYQATRSYSLSSGPTENPAITIETVADGEVSPFLVEVVEPGDTFEIRGPVGGYFVWESELGDTPLLLIAGGSGVAPLRSIWRAAAGAVPVTLLYSVRDRDHIIFGDELAGATEFEVAVHLTREEHSDHRSGRIDKEGVAAAVGSAEPAVFVCGPTDFVEAMAAHLAAAAVEPSKIRTERFG